MKYCTIQNCQKELRAKGFCTMHWYRWNKFGDPAFKTSRVPRQAVIEGDTARIPLGVDGRLGWAVVDAEFASLDKYFWSITTTGYARTTSKNITLHSMVIGKAPTGMVIDHIDRNPMNNRKSNLRFTNKQGNALNSGLLSTNTSGYKGVRFYKNRFHSHIQVFGKHYYLGGWDHIEEALSARFFAECYFWGNIHSL